MSIANEIQTACGSFSRLMESKLISNGRGVDWREETREWLLRRLRQEVNELDRALKNEGPSRVIDECVDVAAFAMMIYDLSYAALKDRRRAMPK